MPFDAFRPLVQRWMTLLHLRACYSADSTVHSVKECCYSNLSQEHYSPWHGDSDFPPQRIRAGHRPVRRPATATHSPLHLQKSLRAHPSLPCKLATCQHVRAAGTLDRMSNRASLVSSWSNKWSSSLSHGLIIMHAWALDSRFHTKSHILEYCIYVPPAKSYILRIFNLKGKERVEACISCLKWIMK